MPSTREAIRLLRTSCVCDVRRAIACVMRDALPTPSHAVARRIAAGLKRDGSVWACDHLEGLVQITTATSGVASLGMPYSLTMQNTTLASVLRSDAVTGAWDPALRRLTFSDGGVLSANLALAYDPGLGVYEYNICTIPQGPYPTPALLVAAVNTALGELEHLWNSSGGALGATLDASGQLVITRTGGTALDFFRILGEQELSTAPWEGVAFDRSRPASINELIGNMGKTTFSNTSATLGPIDLPAATNALYLHSDTLSGLDSLGPHPQSNTCIAKLMLHGAAFGQSIAQSTFRELRYCSVPPQAMQTLEFSLRSARNRIINLRGGKISFVLSFVFPE